MNEVIKSIRSATAALLSSDWDTGLQGEAHLQRMQEIRESALKTSKLAEESIQALEDEDYPRAYNRLVAAAWGPFSWALEDSYREALDMVRALQADPKDSLPAQLSLDF